MASASDILNKVSKDDIDNARLLRESKINQPEYAPMAGDDDMSDLWGDGSGDDFGGGFNDDFGSFAESSSGTDNFNTNNWGGDLGLGGGIDGFNAQFNSGGFNGMGGQSSGMQQEPQRSAEDIFFDSCKNVCTGTLGFLKEFPKSVKEMSKKDLSRWGSYTAITGGIGAIVGGVLLLFGRKMGLSMLLGGILSSGCVGVPVLMFNVSNTNDEPTKDSNIFESKTNEIDNLSETNIEADISGEYSESDECDEFSGYGFEDDDEDFSGYGFGDDGEYTDDEFSNFSDDEFFSMDDFSSVEEEVEVSDGMSVEDALDSLPEIDPKMYTRQYLYDAFTKVLPNVTPDFNSVKVIDSDSEVFLAFDSIIKEAATATGSKETSLPDLISLEETLSTIKLTISRPSSLKATQVADEVARIMAYKDGEFDSKVYATADTLGSRCIITIFTGKTAIVTVKDMYIDAKDFVLDSKNYMPIVLGTDQGGKVIKCDFRKIESIIVAGMPRMGKSWTVQSILTQMCAFIPPSELNIHIYDPKADMSDFSSFKLPHVKRFVSGDENIVHALRKLVREEAPRRKKIIGEAGFVNIWDYRERYPDVHLPVVYVVVDEVVTLSERMDKDTKAEFQSLVTELITQLPALGIRIFLIPHVVKDQVIKKTASDTVKCRISVCGDEAHVESSTGTKPKDFRYKLTNLGDMAVRIPDLSAQTLFVHSGVLSSSNVRNAEIFDYLRRVWSRLEPEELKDSVVFSAHADEENDALINELNSSNFMTDDELFSDEVGVSNPLFDEEDSNGLSSFNSRAVQKDFEDDEPFDLGSIL